MPELETYADFRRALRSYEQAYPNKTFAEVSLALTGQEPIDETVTTVDDAIAGETDVDLTPGEQQALTNHRQLLEALADRQVTTFSMRRYDSSVSDKTPEEINQEGVENDTAMGLLAHGEAITATAEVAVYTLSEKMHAVVWNREFPSGGFTVSVGPYSGGFDIGFTHEVDAYLQRNFYDENWQRPEHFTDDSPWVYENPQTEEVTA